MRPLSVCRPAVAALLLSLLLAPPCLATEKIKEPASGVEFDATDRDGLKLLGAGVRRMMVFNVYALALYVPGDKLEKELGGKTDPESLYRAVIYGTFKKRALLHFVRGIGGDKVRDAFRASLEGNMAAEDLAAEKATLERFYDIMASGGVSDGDVFEFVTEGSKVRVTKGSKEIFSADTVRLARGLWMGWFGANPVCPKLKAALVSRVKEVVE
jgi:hypothetical protein